MGLKYTIAKLEDVEEAVRPLYVQQGDKFVLDVDGVVAKEKLDEFRNNNIELQKQIEKYKDVDPVKYRELMAIQKKITEKELLDKGEVDQLVNLRVAAMRDELEGKLNVSNTELTKAQGQLHVLLIDNVVKSAAIKLGVLPEAVEDVVLRAKGVYVVENGVPTPKGADGKMIYGKDGSSPMGVEEWLMNLKNSARHLFVGSQGSGAGGGRGGPGKMDVTKMTPTEKIAYGLSQGVSSMSRLPADSSARLP